MHKNEEKFGNKIEKINVNKINKRIMNIIEKRNRQKEEKNRYYQSKGK